MAKSIQDIREKKKADRKKEYMGAAGMVAVLCGFLGLIALH